MTLSAHPATRALDDPARLAALYRTGLLDSETEDIFDRFTRLASRVVGAPVSLLSLVEHDRQFFKSATGLPDDLSHIRQTGLDSSFCQYVVTEEAPLVVPDALEDAVLRHNRAVTDLSVRAYLGVPVRAPEGDVIGSLCAIDMVPHEWSSSDRETLEELSDLITTELDLRTSGRRFRAFVESTSQIVFVADAEGDVSQLRRIHPLDDAASSERIDGWNWVDAVHPDDVLRVTEEWREALRARRPYATVHRRMSVSGVHRWTRVQIVPIFEGERLIEFVGTCVDIDDAHRAKSDLEQQTAVLQSFFDTVPGMLGVVEVHEADVSFVIANAATTRFLDRAGEAPPIGSVASGPSPAEMLDVWVEAYHSAIASGRSVEFECSYGTDEGERWLNAIVNSVGHTEAGVPMCSFSAFDVTERRTAERQLLTSRQHLQFAIESAHIGVWEYDFDSDHATWSLRMCAIHGVSYESFDGRATTALELLSAEDQAGVWSQFMGATEQACVGGEVDVSIEYRVTVDGDERWVRTLGRVYAEAGTPTRMAGVSQDVTAEKQHAQALRDARAAALEAQQRAEEVVRLKTSIISNMSHEIRTPLTAILGFADLLAEDPGDPDTIGIIQQSAHRLLDTLNSVLYYAQLESGVPFETDRVDVVRVVRAAVHAYASRAQAKHLDLTVSAPTDPLWLTTNRDALDRMVGHLVSNAVKFTHEGRIDVRMGAGDGCVWIEVADTGIGMSASFVETAFEPFRQESAGMSRAFEGSGLGLSIVRRLTDRMGARLDVQSERDVGSTVRVSMPT